MLNSFWEKIKSGSDIRGVATETQENKTIDLTNEVIQKICRAFIIWLCEKSDLSCEDLSVAVGHDSRLSSNRIKNVIINTLRMAGVTVYDCSLSSTPAMFMAISVLQCTASIQITASHHSFERNGLKFFIAGGGLTANQIEEILQTAQDEPGVLPQKEGTVREINVMSHYCKKLRELIKESVNSAKCYDTPLKGTKIAVDAGNGAGGFFAEDVLKPLGADISGSVCLNPDGNFPVHAANPEDSGAMEYASSATKNSQSDMGIVFDTDVDRAAIIDSCGKQISKSRLIALTSDIILRKIPNSIIVTDSVTSEGLKTFIENRGGTQFRYKRGYNNVISMARKINEKGGNCPLAMETSGHAAFRENNFVDDGAYLACKIISEMVKSKSENKDFSYVLKDLSEPVSEINMRFPVRDYGDIHKLDKIGEDIKKYLKSFKGIEIDEENIEGVRLHFKEKRKNGWLLLRKSIHDPVLILYAESYAPGGAQQIVDFAKSFLNKYGFLNLD